MKSFFSGVFVGALLYMVLDMHVPADAFEVTSIATASAQLLQEPSDWGGEVGDNNDDENYTLPPPPPGPNSHLLGDVRAVVMAEDPDDRPDDEYNLPLASATTTPPPPQPPTMNRPGANPPPAQFHSQPI